MFQLLNLTFGVFVFKNKKYCCAIHRLFLTLIDLISRYLTSGENLNEHFKQIFL